MVKGALGRLPVNNREILPVVLGMATHAVLVTGLTIHHGEVETLVGIEARRDIGVAVETLEALTAGPELVTGYALQGAIERRVRLRQRPRGYLRSQRVGDESQDADTDTQCNAPKSGPKPQ